MLVIACLTSFSKLFSAANNPESIENINRRYEAAQTLQSASSDSNSNASEPWAIFLSDNTGAHKRTEVITIRREPPKRQRINPPEDKTSDFITRCLGAGDYNAIRLLYNQLSVELQNKVILKITNNNPDEFQKIMRQKLHEGDFFTVHTFAWLLPADLRPHFFIKIKGKDSQDILCLSPYVATRFSNTLKRMSFPGLIATKGLYFKNTPLSALHNIVQIFDAISKAETTQGLNRNTIDRFVQQLINSGLFANETPETFKGFFEVAGTLDVVPLIKNILALGVLSTIRQRFNSAFNLLDNLLENDKKLIARASFMDLPHYTGSNPENFKKEDAWRSKHYAVSVADVAQHFHPGYFNSLPLHLKNITSLDGLSAIPNAANMRHIDLSHNRLTTLPAHAFVAFRNLKVLRLHNNKLRTLHPDAFQSLTNAESIDLSKNKLRAMKPDDLQGLINLQSLDLSSNPLKNIDLSMFNHVPALTTLIVTDTPFAHKRELHKRICSTYKETTGKKLRIIKN